MITAETYEPGRIGVYTFVGRVEARLVRHGDDAVRVDGCIGDARAIPGPPIVFRFPRVEPAPYLPEGYFGEVSHVTAVRAGSDGSVNYEYAVVGNYSNWYDGPRARGGNVTIPAWWVRAARTAIEEGACLVEMENRG